MPHEHAPSLPKKPPQSNFVKNLFLAGALHAGVGVAAHVEKRVADTLLDVRTRTQERIARTFEEHEIAQTRTEMLDTARQAQAEHRPWAGRFLIQSWFIEKRAAHEPYNDQRDIQEKYNRLLAELRTKTSEHPTYPRNYSTSVRRSSGRVRLLAFKRRTHGSVSTRTRRELCNRRATRRVTSQRSFDSRRRSPNHRRKSTR